MNKIRMFFPTFVCILLSTVCGLIYFLAYTDSNIGDGLIIFTIPLISLILPVLSFIIKKEIPISFNIMLIILSYAALVLGTSFNFYDRIKLWDVYCHTYFGFFICFYFYYLFVNKAFKRKEKVLALVLTFFFVVCAATLWELIEFTFDNLLNQDSQRVGESLANGHVGTFDTIVDILVAILGMAIYAVLYIIDARRGFKLHDSLVKVTLFNENKDI